VGLHIVPKCWGKAQGGTDDINNLVTACRACNTNKGTSKFDDVDHAKHWLDLYKKHCADAYYQTYVVRKETGKWNVKRKLDAVWEKFIKEGGRGTRYKRNIKQISPADAMLHPGL
jgi:HNH endonuclease